MQNAAATTETIWQELIGIALQRDQALADLTELAEAQRLMLVEGRHADLAANIQSQDRALADLAVLDQQEVSLISELPAESSPELRRKYAVLADKSTLAAQQLKSLVHGNRELFENAVQYVAFSLGALSTLAVDEPASYNPRPDGAANSAALMLDRKV